MGMRKPSEDVPDLKIHSHEGYASDASENLINNCWLDGYKLMQGSKYIRVNEPEKNQLGSTEKLTRACSEKSTNSRAGMRQTAGDSPRRGHQNG
jgi:hypothetical protein